MSTSPPARLLQIVETALLDHADTAELTLTVAQVQGLAHAVAARLSAPAVTLPKSATVLTGQQIAVLRALAEGERTAKTARRLGLSENTIKTHRSRVYSILGATGGAPHAVALGFCAGVLAVASAPAASSDRLRLLLARAEGGVRP